MNLYICIFVHLFKQVQLCNTYDVEFRNKQFKSLQYERDRLYSILEITSENRFWLAWIHGGGITGTCGRSVFQWIGESGLSLVRRPAAAFRGVPTSGAQPYRPWYTLSTDKPTD